MQFGCVLFCMFISSRGVFWFRNVWSTIHIQFEFLWAMDSVLWRQGKSVFVEFTTFDNWFCSMNRMKMPNDLHGAFRKPKMAKVSKSLCQTSYSCVWITSGCAKLNYWHYWNELIWRERIPMLQNSSKNRRSLFQLLRLLSHQPPLLPLHPQQLLFIVKPHRKPSRSNERAPWTRRMKKRKKRQMWKKMKKNWKVIFLLSVFLSFRFLFVSSFIFVLDFLSGE